MLALGIALCSVGCATRQVQNPLPELEPIEINETPRDNALEKQFWESVAKAQVIYVAERHDDDATHQYQFDLIKSMRSRGIPFAIGWEMFEISDADKLSAWQAKKVTTDQFLKEIGWQKSWGVYSQMYEQMLRWSLSSGIQSIALNAPRSLSKKMVSGESLSPEETAMLPQGFETPKDGYENFVEKMGMHPGVKGRDLTPYYRAQQLWEQTMAMRICAFIEKNPKVKLVVFLGRGHASNDYGVPFYVRQRGQPRQFMLNPHDPMEGQSLELAERPRRAQVPST